ncbi:hypothetical protein J3458_016195 [Metarhizium acridum]|uniref:uncharacterized protein n=1 Tax=Metarhizium acridum TaxID=92637 RepID=UPI001C6B719A|nr:hypothetical protein J3458_016195 [Metarhizium acridum]
MVVATPTSLLNRTQNHPAPTTDLPLGLILLIVFALALLFHVICRHLNPDVVTARYETTSSDDGSDRTIDSNIEPSLDRVAPTTTYKKWRIETSEVAKIGSGFDTCAICLEPMLDEDEIRQLQCEHIFHSSCFGQWFFSHDTCPVCKSCVIG